MTKLISHISGKQLTPQDAHRGGDLREALLRLIQKDYPDFGPDSHLSFAELNKYRRLYLSELIRGEVGQYNRMEKEVVDAITHNKILSENIEEDIEEKLSIGQRAADAIAAFGGSWKFIIFFFSFMLGWIVLNIWALSSRAFDPYPFILLNLMLSCLAAIQAPIIMMSQNRQAEKDRRRSEHDYKVNLKAELEIKLLHEKIDHLMIHQNKILLEIQEVQTDYLEDILKEMCEDKLKK